MAESLGQMTVGLRAVTFVGAVFAALVAAQLYTLIRSGEVGQGWRSFIVGALVFAVWALANFANTYFGPLFAGPRMTLVMDLLQSGFAILFAAGLWSHRQAFYHPDRHRPADAAEGDGDEAEEWFDPQPSGRRNAA